MSDEKKPKLLDLLRMLGADEESEYVSMSMEMVHEIIETMEFDEILQMEFEQWKLSADSIIAGLNQQLTQARAAAMVAQDVIAHLLRVHENRDPETSRKLAWQMVEAAMDKQ